MDDELLGRRVVGRRGFEVLDVAAVAGLGHGEAADEVQVDDVRDQAGVAFRAQIRDGAAEQTPLHACLDHERKVVLRQHLDPGDGHARVARAAVLGAESGGGDAGRDEVPQLRKRALPRVLHAQLVVERQVQLGQLLPGGHPHVTPFPVDRDTKILIQSHGAKLLTPEAARGPSRLT